MKKIFRASIQTCKRHAAMQPWLWLKRLSFSIGITFTLGCCANIASAQLPSPGYVFVELSDEASRPVSGAAVVLYDLKGNEIGSNVTDQKNQASIRRRSYHSEGKLIVRVVKPGFVTQEVMVDTTPREYWQILELKLKLVAVSKPGGKVTPAPRKQKPARSSKRAPPGSGPSP